MSNFIQLHFLTSYPPSNLNRDDLGRPKNAIFGGTQRLRVSSQSLKRSWRCSEAFSQGVEGQKGTRTKDLGNVLFDKLKEGLGEKKADEAAKALAKRYGSLKAEDKAKPNPAEARQNDTLVFVSPEELAHLDLLAKTLVSEKRAPTEEELEGFPMSGLGAADISLFGRMLANTPGKNVEAAAQVAHALSVHKVTIEDDFFTAVDDLNKHDQDAGAGHMGNVEFAAGLFYEYVCIDRDLLVKNLGGGAKEELAQKTLHGLGDACLTVSPGGKKNSFGSIARASYALVEKGNQQPRSLSVAFLKAIDSPGYLTASIGALKETRDQMDRAYDKCWSSNYELDVPGGKGTLAELLAFMSKA
jgi:CRISPR system Cascade subunit CasC